MSGISFGKSEISSKSYVHPKAEVIGRVIIEDNVLIAPNASIRADEGSPFKISKGCNVQDGVVMHGLYEKYVTVGEEKFSIFIGSHCSIAHQAMIHGPTFIDKKTFVGFRAIVHNSRIGKHCHIGHGAIVVGVEIPDNRYVGHGMVIDSQDKVKRLSLVTEEDNNFNKEVVDVNKRMKEVYQLEEEQTI